MKVVKTVEDVRNFVNEQKKQGKSIGLVPTMGFLHKGHRSLIERARKENDAVIVSIFVNPTQFGPNEDYDNYPKDLESDMKMCEKCGVDLIFNPNPENIYEMHHKTYINVEDISGQLCGLSRPTHFRGVCTIVAKLFNISKADRAYFGQKDAQQLAILKKMVKDLNFDIELIACPIVREKDGLAMSSRNKYLTELEREDATVLYRSIQAAKAIIKKGVKAQDVVKVMSEVIAEVSYAKIDYIQVVDAEFLQPVDVIDEDVLVALAVYIGKARLIDNFVYEV
ncbi:MAG: pantoate--beta-alanine ligase [Eubacterium sp.]|nr:pantoate--beta-alanine ligase [Eubacterium sp.]